MYKMIKKFYNATPAVKASMALLFANLILKGISLISGPIYTRIMTTEQYGMVSNFLAWQNILMVIVTLNLSSGVFNNGMLDYKDDRDSFMFSLLTVSSISTLVFFIIFLMFKNFVVQLFEIPEILVYVMFANFLFVPAYSYWSGKQRYEFKYKLSTIITLGIAIFSMIFGIFAVIHSPNDKTAVTKIMVTEGINILVGIAFFFYIIYKAKFKCKFTYCKYALKFNIPLLPHYISIYVLSSSDRVMITKMVGNSATAIYSVAYTIASVITIIWSSIEASLSPWIYEKLENSDKDSVKKITLQVIFIFGMMCLGCTLFAPEVMMILAPDNYAEGIYIIPSIAVGVFFTAMYSLYMRVELFFKQITFATVATTITAILNVILNYVFIGVFGYMAAGYTTMVCYGLLTLFHYINVRKKGFSDIFDNRIFLYMSIIISVLLIGVVLLYSMNYLRYIIIVVMFILLIVKRKYIFGLFKF